MEKCQLVMAFVGKKPVIIEDVAPPGTDSFRFEMCHSPANFAGFAFEKWWLDKRSIYPQRKRKANNFRALIDFWWRSRQLHSESQDQKVCESYLLASLLKETRSTGSRRVVNDSIPRNRWRGRVSKQYAATDNRMFKASSTGKLRRFDTKSATVED